MLTRKEHTARWKDPAYIAKVERQATALKSDGCTGVPDFFLLGCYEHDIAYRTHMTPLGEPITREQADLCFRWYIQMRSWFGKYSPLAWWRWRAVMRFGGRSWGKTPVPLP